MGFTNTTYRETADNLIQGFKDRLTNNPYYIYSNLKPTPVTYWNINIHKSTLDQGSREIYDQLGENAPLRYNKVNNMQLYGIDRMMVDYQKGDYGVESPLEGEAVILPHTIIPCVDDYFTINYVNDIIIFRVQSVTIDTLENDANFYKIRFYLDKTDEKSLKALNSLQLVEEYEYIPGNIGTNYATLMKTSDKDLIDRLSSLMDTIKKYYIDLFYRPNVQTFILHYDHMHIYDPYLIEFIIRNGLMNIGDYLYISQAVHKPRTFNIEYDRTIFKDIEERNSQLSRVSNYPVPVHDPNSLLLFRMEDYYELSINLMKWCKDPINNIDLHLFDRIEKNNPYNIEDPKLPLYRNLIIRYLNGVDSVCEKALVSLEHLHYRETKDFFYELPILLYIIQQYIMLISAANSAEEPTEKCYMLGE